eukprot:scaffold147785_cov23-Cyclotella_meneghiniana.AAC.1
MGWGGLVGVRWCCLCDGMFWVVLASAGGAELIVGAQLSGAGMVYAGLAAVRGVVLLVGKVTFGGVVDEGVLAVEAGTGLVLLALGIQKKIMTRPEVCV